MAHEHMSSALIAVLVTLVAFLVVWRLPTRQPEAVSGLVTGLAAAGVTFLLFLGLACCGGYGGGFFFLLGLVVAPIIGFAVGAACNRKS